VPTFLFVLSLAVLSTGQASGLISGIVVDPQGKTVPNATVGLELSGMRIDEIVTGADGRFEFRSVLARPVDLVVTAPGFAPAYAILSGDAPRVVRIALNPAPLFEAVQVTSARSETARLDPTVTTTVLTEAELTTSAALNVDDALRMIPGFTLLPPSRVANPTTQTMMLRGLGGSGVTRSLVLADGVPLNDAFGGWVYWDKIPQAAIDRIEVLRGGGSDLYGTDAVGGVVQILTLQPFRPTARGRIEAGNLGTDRVSIFGGGRRGGWRFSAAGQRFTTDGYVLVAEDDRGTIETPSSSAHRSARVAGGHQAPGGWRFDASASIYSEDRVNGTPLQVNDTDARQWSSEVAGGLGGGFLSAHVFATTQSYDETFSELSAEPPRVTERLTRVQRVPTRLVGFTVQWSRAWRLQNLLIGSEGRFIKGDVTETRFSAAPSDGPGDPVAVHRTDVSGISRIGSAFMRATMVFGDRWTVIAGGHADAWQSVSEGTAFRQTIGSFSPRAAVSYRLGEIGLALRGSVYGGFRAPTLSELYRSVQAGSDVTDPNEALRPETLRAGDGGVLFSRGRLSARATVFWAVLDDTITNVTISTSPSLNVRQRQNADKMRSAGLEYEADLRLTSSWSVSVTGAIIDARFAGNTRLNGYRVPQVAGDSLGVSARYVGASWTISGQLWMRGPQYEDDVNALAVDRATVVDVFGSRRITRGFDLFVAVENALDADYAVGRIPVRLVGLPRSFRVGAQLAFP
jgi:outer membrane cobalamin receptor